MSLQRAIATIGAWHPDSPLLDGAMPRSGAERVAILLDYAESLIPDAIVSDLGTVRLQAIVDRLARLRDEYETESAREVRTPLLIHPQNEYEHWHETEDEILDVISALLPEPWYCTIHPDDCGTVVIWSDEEDDEYA